MEYVSSPETAPGRWHQCHRTDDACRGCHRQDHHMRRGPHRGGLQGVPDAEGKLLR